jgi:Flp pilus assembly protein CpaB
VRNWRVLTAVAAVILAVIAGVLVYKVSDDAKKDAKKPFSFESVMVVAKPIPTSMSFASALDGKYIVRADRVHNELPEGAVSGRQTDAQLNATFKGQVASHAIVADQTIVSADFVAASQVASGLGAQLDLDNKAEKEHLEAVTVTLDDTHAVGGFLQPGDHVNVMATLGVDKNHIVTSDHIKFTSFMIPNLKVLAVGTTTSVPSTSASTNGSTPTTVASNRSLITFEVTPRQAEQLVQGSAVGTLYLTMNSPSFKDGDFKDPGEVVEAINLFDKQLPAVDAAQGFVANK